MSSALSLSGKNTFRLSRLQQLWKDEEDALRNSLIYIHFYPNLSGVFRQNNWVKVLHYEDKSVYFYSMINLLVEHNSYF